MTVFEFITAGRIVFGRGAIAQIGALAQSYGERALVVTGGSVERARIVQEALNRAGIAHTAFAVAHEPTVDLAQQAVRMARDFGAQVVIGFGGGAAVDLGKAVAALATNPGDPLDYLEVIGRGKLLGADPLPYLAVPTTAGTGAEVTRNAVLAQAGTPRQGQPALA